MVINMVHVEPEHQDYATWVPSRGNSVYVTNHNWGEYNSELCYVIWVNGERVQCNLCGSENNVFKAPYDTPGFLNTAEGTCLDCIKKTYGNDLITDDVLKQSS